MTSTSIFTSCLHGRNLREVQGEGSPSGSEGRKGFDLKHGWPGTITQWSDEAFEGSILTDPHGDDYLLEPFNKSPIPCSNTPVSLAGTWADDTVGSVCSAFIWPAMKDINMTLEGGVLEPQDQGI